MSGPDVNTAVEFYQGTGGTRFYPSVIVNGESWVGIRNSDTYTGAQALDTARLSGLYMDVLQGIARENDQFAQGYGQSGVCNDSVAVIQLAVGVIDAPTTYPLLINKDLVGDYLERMVKERPHLAADYRRLQDAVRRMPLDRRVNSSAPGRILRSIPYESGSSTPYPGFNDARRIFGGK
jgi:hypothetical protein